MLRVSTQELWNHAKLYLNFLSSWSRRIAEAQMQGNRVIIYRNVIIVIWWCEDSSSFKNIYRGIILKGSLFDIWNDGCFILYETSSSEWFIAVPESESRFANKVHRKDSMAWFIASSWDQSPENDLRKIPENRRVCGVGSTSPITTVVMIFLSKLHGWSTCVDWEGILRIQEGT